MAQRGWLIWTWQSYLIKTWNGQIEFIQKSGIVTAMVGMLNAHPGTKLYERMGNEGRLIAAFRSSIQLGFLGRERFQHWKMLSWTFFRRPRLVTMAITFAIYGYHFRKISKLSSIQ
jgi:Domain of unknown function (DUF4070)